MTRASQVAQWKRIRLPMKETQELQVRLLGQEDPLEKEMATHSSIFAWEILGTEEPGRLQSVESQRVRHHWAHTLACVHALWPSLESPTTCLRPYSLAWIGHTPANFKGSEDREEYPQIRGRDFRSPWPLDFGFDWLLLLLTLGLFFPLSFCSSRLPPYLGSTLSLSSVWAYLFIFYGLFLLHGCGDGVILYLSLRKTCHLSEFAAHQTRKIIHREALFLVFPRWFLFFSHWFYQRSYFYRN